ncbi:hypothetical protein [Adhaeribacter aquaticus]|uniref:hypothetical protein n=1 Tax=Adhaeribacter aquaticus TaxID=299567 RepID=UPI0003F4C634|nr:hypothetical protein [Adhaeribacter aquaticus]
MKKVLVALGILLSLLVLAGALIFYFIPREKLLPYVTPEVKYVTVTNAIIGDTTATMDVQLEVTSKLIPVFVDSIVYNFHVYNQSLAQGNQKFSPDSKVGKVQTLSIPVKVEHTKAQPLVKQQIADGKKIQANVEAHCRLPLVGIRRFNFSREVDMAVPVMPGTDIISAK